MSRDNKATYDYAIQQATKTAFDEGAQKGVMKVALEVARLVRSKGELIEKIMKHTGLTEAQIKKP